MDTILGIEVIEIGPDYLKAKMPVSERVRQPMGIVRDGAIIAVCRPIHKGRTTHVWDIRLHEEATGKLSCISRLTVQIVERSVLV